MRVLVTGDVLVENAEREFKEHGVDVLRRPAGLNESELVDALEGSDGYIHGGGEKVTGAAIDAATRLKAIVFWGDQPDACFTAGAIERMKARGITLETTGYSVNAVAEMTIFLIGAALRNIPYLVDAAYSGRWLQEKGKEIGGKTVGIMGMGRVGQSVAVKLSGFGVREVLYYDIRRNDAAENELGARYVGLPKLLSLSDIVTLHLPLSPRTRGIIGKDEFAAMKPTALLVDAAEPLLVDENALYEALKNDVIAKAVFDGYYVKGTELSPDAAGRLLSLPLRKFWFTPHTASNTRENDIQQSEEAFELMIQVLSEQSST